MNRSLTIQTRTDSVFLQRYVLFGGQKFNHSDQDRLCASTALRLCREQKFKHLARVREKYPILGFHKTTDSAEGSTEITDSRLSLATIRQTALLQILS